MLRVLKFGGSSVASATAISRVLDIVDALGRDGRTVLVSSAISGCTDALLSISAAPSHERAALAEPLKQRHLDIATRLFTGAERVAAAADVERLFGQLLAAPDAEIVTYGELLSTALIARKLACDGYRAQWLDARELIVKGDIDKTYTLLQQAFSATDAEICILPGFIARDGDGRITTLGRGGSDYTAALVAAALQADSLQIWTDVPGIMTANPRQVGAARTLPVLSYRAALEMAGHGAKVLYAPTVAPAMEKGIDIEIRNTFAPEGRYTVITDTEDAAPWIGLASQGEDLFLIGSSAADPSAAVKTVEAVLKEQGIAARSIVPEGSHLKVSVRESVLTPALRALHKAFFEVRALSEINLFIAGYGSVGKALVEMVGRTAATVAARTGKALRIAGIANSRRCVIDLSGIAPSQAGERLFTGGCTDFIGTVCAVAPKGSIFVDCTDSETLYRRYPELFQAGIGIVSSNRRSFAVPFVEYAALQAAARENGVPFRYETTVGASLPILESIARGANSCDEVLSIEAVVSCTLNQILSAYGSGVSFASLVRAAQESGLTEPDPRLDLGGRDVLRKLLILSREAGVSLEESDVDIQPLLPPELFSASDAAPEGTRPPLSAGVTSVSLEGPVPGVSPEGSSSLGSASLEDFYRALEALEPHFAALAEAAARKGCRNRFVATLRRTASAPASTLPASPASAPASASDTPASAPAAASASSAPRARSGFTAAIRLEAVPETHPAYHLSGTQNAIIVRSAFHPSPLVIQGPGEGAPQAASSILNDILR